MNCRHTVLYTPRAIMVFNRNVIAVAKKFIRPPLADSAGVRLPCGHRLLHAELAKAVKRKDHLKYHDLTLGRALANEAFNFEPLAGPAVPTTILHSTADTDVSIKLNLSRAKRPPSVDLVEVTPANRMNEAPVTVSAA